MAKARAVDVVQKLVVLLESLEEGTERTRAIQAALTLIGGGKLDALPGTSAALPSSAHAVAQGELAYFAAKDPRTKIEELAVAARYREQRMGATSSGRAELEGVIKSARRNFDGNNFRRDLENARKASLFTRGTGKDAAVLSSFGQRYVDALPNRESVGEIPRRKRARKRRKTGD